MIDATDNSHISGWTNDPVLRHRLDIMFTLDPRLAQDSHFIARTQGCQIRLMDDRRFCWLLLIPEQADLVELHDLDADDFARIAQLTRQLGARLARHKSADKINSAAIGNIVQQLHIHIIAREAGDPLWPNPVWGTPPQRYTGAALATEITALKALTDTLS